jgi:hypothetical protein
MNSLNSFGKFIENLLMQLKDEIYNNAPFDKTKKGRICEVVSKRQFRVEIAGKNYIATANTEYAIGDVVWVRIPCGNTNNMYIEAKTQ